MDYGEQDYGYLDPTGFDLTQIDLRQSFGGGDLSPSLSPAVTSTAPAAPTTTSTVAASAAPTTAAAASSGSGGHFDASRNHVAAANNPSAAAPGSQQLHQYQMQLRMQQQQYMIEHQRIQQQQQYQQQQYQQYQQQQQQQHQQGYYQQPYLHQQQPQQLPPQQQQQPHPHHLYHPQQQQQQQPGVGGISIPSHHARQPQNQPPYQGQYQHPHPHLQQPPHQGLPYRTASPGMPAPAMDDINLYEMDDLEDPLEAQFPTQFVNEGGVGGYYPDFGSQDGIGVNVADLAPESRFYYPQAHQPPLQQQQGPHYGQVQPDLLPTEPSGLKEVGKKPAAAPERKKKSQRPEDPEEDEDGSPEEFLQGKDKPPRKKSSQGKATGAAAAAAVAAVAQASASPVPAPATKKAGAPAAEGKKTPATADRKLKEKDSKEMYPEAAMGISPGHPMGVEGPGPQPQQQQQATSIYQQQFSHQIRQAQYYQIRLKLQQVQQTIMSIENELTTTPSGESATSKDNNRMTHLIHQHGILIEQKNRLQSVLEQISQQNMMPGQAGPTDLHQQQGYGNQGVGAHDPNLYTPIIHVSGNGPNPAANPNPGLSSSAATTIAPSQVTSPPPPQRKESPSGGYRSPVSTPSTPSTPKPMSTMMSSFSMQNFQPEKQTPVMSQDSVTAASPSQLLSTWVPFSHMNIAQPMDTLEAFPSAPHQPPQFQSSTAQRALAAQQQQQQPQQSQDPGNFQVPHSVRKVSGKPQLIRSVSFTNTLPSQADQPEEEVQKIASPGSAGAGVGGGSGSRSNNSSPSSTRPVIMKSKRSNSTPSVITNLAGSGPGSPILSPVGGPKLKAKASVKGPRPGRAKAPVGTNLEGQIRTEIQTTKQQPNHPQSQGDDYMMESKDQVYQHYPIEESQATRVRLSGDKTKWGVQGTNSDDNREFGSNSDEEEKPSSRRTSRTHEPEEEDEDEEDEEGEEDGDEEVDLEDNSDEENSGEDAQPAAKGAIKARSKSSDGVLAAGAEEGGGKKLTRRKSSDNSQKTFPCDVEGCTKVFKRSEHLKRHTRTHTGERPFVCNFPGCTRAFSRTDNLAQHQKTHVAGTEKKKRIKKSNSGGVRQPEDED